MCIILDCELPEDNEGTSATYVDIDTGGGGGVKGGVTRFGEETLRAVSTVLNGIFTNRGD